jgi:hypothetical protein
MNISAFRQVRRVVWLSAAAVTVVVTGCVLEEQEPVDGPGDDEALVVDLSQPPVEGFAPYADVELPVDSCHSLGAAFGDALASAVTTTLADGQTTQERGEIEGLSASWLEQIAHINSLSEALTRSGLQCDPEQLLVAAETKLPASVRATIHVGVPAAGELGVELESYDAWRASMQAIFAVVTSPPEELEPGGP